KSSKLASDSGDDSNDCFDDYLDDLNDPDYQGPRSEEEARKFAQAELDDIIRVLAPGGLTKKSQEFLAAELKSRKMVHSEVKITRARTRHRPYEEFYKEEGNYLSTNT